MRGRRERWAGEAARIAPAPCLGARLLGALLLAAGLLGCAPPAPTGLLFISIDTVRRDHLPTYAYPRETAPATAAIAVDGVVFDNAFAQDTNTNPSHTSMFTGVYPNVHGSLENGHLLREGEVPLAEILRDAGFRTAGFVSGVTMHRKSSGLDRGFEVYEDRFRTRRRDGQVATRLAAKWLAERGEDERWFLFVHLYDAHGAYRPRGKYAEMFRAETAGRALERIPPYQYFEGAGVHLNPYVDRYDAMIRYADDQIARLLEGVDPERTVVVILSDHGETLGERYQALDHGGQVFDEQIRIPLVIRAPNFAPRRVGATVETIDLLPTLLELLHVPLPASRPVQGRSLVPLMSGASTEGRDLAFASARAVDARHADRGYRMDARRRILAVRSNDWKLIRYPGVTGDYLELYDLRADPGERTNVVERYPQVRDEYLAALDQWLGGAEPGPAPTIDPEILLRLRELGYAD